MTWKCQDDQYTEGRYGMILGIELITKMGLDLNVSERVIIGGSGTYEGCLVTMVDIRNYEFKYVTYKIVKPVELFINL